MKIQWNPDNPSQALLFCLPEQIKEKAPELLEKSTLLNLDEPFRFCEVVSNQGELSGTFVIPQKEHPIRDRMSFAFVLSQKSLYFISGDPKFRAYLDRFMNSSDIEETSPFRFLLRFLNYLIQEDAYFLEDYNMRLEEIEENIFEGRESGMEEFIMQARRDMNILGNYYLQLTAVGQQMEQTSIPQNSPDENAMISLFLSRSSVLRNLVQTIKDNTDQIWNLRQTQLSDRQNKISTLLTVISTIFLPLTFLTGWYGMNFKHMPLIDWNFGYLAVIAIVIGIVCFEVGFIRRRHWLSSTSASQKPNKEEKAARKADRPSHHSLM